MAVVPYISLLIEELPLSAFTGQHIYKIEWQPGPDGYLYWYGDFN